MTIGLKTILNMRKNSRNKGSRFERTVAKAWESWSGYKFSRTPGSGGWAKAKDAMGDLVCTDEKHSRRFAFSIECKNYQDIRFEHLLLGLKSCKISSFWAQAVKDASKANRIPVLIMRYNSMPKGEAFFVIEAGALDLFLMSNCKELSRMEVKTSKAHLAIYMFKEIQRLVSYSDVHKYARKLVK